MYRDVEIILNYFKKLFNKYLCSVYSVLGTNSFNTAKNDR